jgi:vacuolar iron transporter family protein
MSRSELRTLTNYVFGGSAAIITNVSIIVGLGSAGASKGAVLGSLLTIALADNISDSLGIHLYKEAEGTARELSILSTVLNFSARLVVSLTFVAMVLLLPTSRAIPLAIAWGLFLLVVMSYLISRNTGRRPLRETAKHVIVAIAVILLSHSVGHLIAQHFS